MDDDRLIPNAALQTPSAKGKRGASSSGAPPPPQTLAVRKVGTAPMRALMTTLVEVMPAAHINVVCRTVRAAEAYFGFEF